MTEQLVFTASEVAKLLNVSPRLIYDEIRRQNIRAVHLGRSIRITRGALSEYLGEKQTADPEEPTAFTNNDTPLSTATEKGRPNGTG